MLDQAAIAMRFASYLDLLILAGLAAFLIYGTRSSGTQSLGPVCRRWFAGGALLGVAFSGVGLLITAANMAGVPLGQLDLPSVWFVLGGTSFGIAAMVRCAALVLAALAALFLRDPRAALRAVAVLGSVAVASLAWSGHAIIDEGARGWGHLVADVLHLWAAGLWVGALVGLILLLFKPLDAQPATGFNQAHDALAKFSVTGTVLVTVVFVTGLVNGQFLVGIAHITALWTTGYGWLLFAKLMLFGAMLGLAAANRFLLTPSLARAMAGGRPQAAVTRLRWSLALELTSAVTIFGLVAWLGTLEPPISAAM
jgi:putative copper resistance protein D